MTLEMVNLSKIETSCFIMFVPSVSLKLHEDVTQLLHFSTYLWTFKLNHVVKSRMSGGCSLGSLLSCSVGLHQLLFFFYLWAQKHMSIFNWM